MIEIEEITALFADPDDYPIMWTWILDDNAMTERYASDPTHAFENFCSDFPSTKKEILLYSWLQAFKMIGQDLLEPSRRTRRATKDAIVKQLLAQGLNPGEIIVFNHSVTVIQRCGMFIALWTETNEEYLTETRIAICDKLYLDNVIQGLRQLKYYQKAEITSAPCDEVADLIIHPEIIWEDKTFKQSIDKVYGRDLRLWFEFHLNGIKAALNSYGYPKRLMNIIACASREDNGTPDKNLANSIEEVWKEDICKMKVLGLSMDKDALPDYEQSKAIIWETYVANHIIQAINNIKDAKKNAFSQDNLRLALEVEGFKVLTTPIDMDFWLPQEPTIGVKLKRSGIEVALKPSEKCYLSDAHGWALEIRTEHCKWQHTAVIEKKNATEIARTLARLDIEASQQKMREHFDEMMTKEVTKLIKKISRSKALDYCGYENDLIDMGTIFLE